MKIYIRTEEGQVAAYSPQSALPRKLKSILKVVDGKTSTQVFKNNLHSFGDVAGLLHSLEIAGLLKEVLDVNQAGRAEHAAATLERIQLPTQSNFPVSQNAADFSAQQNFQYAPSLSHSSTEMDVNIPKSAVLQATLDEMADFVLANMPEESFKALKEIEEITSLEILAATLGGYEQMLSNTGQSGAAHLQSIKSTLREHL